MSLPPGGSFQHQFPKPPRWRMWLGRTFLKWMGWRVEADMPETGRFAVALGLPHTSNWDFPYSIATAWVIGLHPRWYGKHTLFRGPMGWLLRAFGGIPVRRDQARGVVEQAVDAFAAHPEGLVLMVQPEGTRSWRPYWKSGFYRIAVEAGVPIMCSFLDFSRKTSGVKAVFHLTGDVHADMAKIREVYAGVTGKHPDLASPMRLRQEDEAHDTAQGTALPTPPDTSRGSAAPPPA